MKFIFVLEDDVRIQREIFDTLKDLDSSLGIRFFLNLSEFHEWLKQALSEGAPSLASAGHALTSDTTNYGEGSDKDQLRLVIAKNEFLGVKNMSLIKRARDFFIRKNLCTTEEPTSLILTAFDSPDFDISLAEERIINNVIFKPFDKLILKQHLNFALHGRHALATADLASFQMKATLEMLKEVPLHTLSEIGFSTLNNHPIPAGAISKYYGDLFASKDRKSAFAICHSSEDLGEGQFLCHFHLYGADNQQIQNIKRTIFKKPEPTKKILRFEDSRSRKVLVLEENPTSAADIRSTMNFAFDNAEIFIYDSMAQLLSDLADKETVHRQVLPASFDYLVANFSFFEIEKAKKWQQLQEALELRSQAQQQQGSLTKLVLLSRKNINPEDLREMTSWCSEVFFYPLEKGYIAKRMTASESLKTKKEISLASIDFTDSLKVANPVEITQISEAGLILKYYRPLGIGGFREFILWRPNELENPEIIGSVNYTEKDPHSEAHLNHFVFFGMTDFYLKHLRLWLREAYVRSKATAD